MTTQPLPVSVPLPQPTPVVRMPRGTAVTAPSPSSRARNGTGHLNGRLGSFTAFVLAALAALLVTALMRIAL